MSVVERALAGGRVHRRQEEGRRQRLRRSAGRAVPALLRRGPAAPPRSRPARARDSSSTPRATSSPTTTWCATRSEITVTLNDRRTLQGQGGRRRSRDRRRRDQDRGRQPADAAARRLRRLRVGDWAIAIGNPLGQLRGSVTVGIISAQGRSRPQHLRRHAALTRTSSRPTRRSTSATRAARSATSAARRSASTPRSIRAARASASRSRSIWRKHVAEQLDRRRGTVKRAMIGVLLAELTPELAEGFGIRDSQGVLIQNVVEDTPAAARRTPAQRRDRRVRRPAGHAMCRSSASRWPILRSAGACRWWCCATASASTSPSR